MNRAAFSPNDEPHRRVRAAVAAHFRGRVTPADESTMRAHLPTCASCHRRYQRHLILAELNPGAPTPFARLGRGLGFRLSRPRGWKPWLAGLAIPAAALALLYGFPGHRAGPPGLAPNRTVRDEGDSPTFVPRGARSGAHAAVVPGMSAPAAPSPAFWTYVIGSGGRPRLAERVIAAHDELAFAYSNPAGKAYLMIYAVDQRGHVYWFHPAWRAGDPPPTAVRAARGPGPHELPAAIRHDLPLGSLQVFALLSEVAFDAARVERMLKTTGGGGPTGGWGNETSILRRGFEVTP